MDDDSDCSRVDLRLAVKERVAATAGSITARGNLFRMSSDVLQNLQETEQNAATIARTITKVV